MQQEAKTVLIVDDHPAFRASARQLLESEGYNVVGEAEDGAAAVSAAERLRPAVMLLDVQLPDFDGFEVAQRVTASANGGGAPLIVLVSSRDRSDFGPLLDAAPIRGFISKSELSGAALAELLA